jgi:hypothetical protein
MMPANNPRMAPALRENLGRHHFGRRPDPEFAVHQIEHSIDQRQDRIDLVRHEQHCGVMAAPTLVDQRRDQVLVGEVEAEQRLVAQQDPRVADQSLRDPQSLLLTAGHGTDGSVGKRLGADLCDGVVDDLAATTPTQ